MKKTQIVCFLPHQHNQNRSLTFIFPNRSHHYHKGYFSHMSSISKISLIYNVSCQEHIRLLNAVDIQIYVKTLRITVKVRMASRFQRMRAAQNHKRVLAMKYVWALSYATLYLKCERFDTQVKVERVFHLRNLGFPAIQRTSISA